MNNLKNYIIKIILIIEGPFITKASSPGHFGVVAIPAKNSKNLYYIPGTLIKGNIKHALEELNGYLADDKKNNDINMLFGCESGNIENKKGSVEPNRGILKFSDFMLDDNNEKNADVIYRITIDDERGSVKKHQLQAIESPFLPCEPLNFFGEISFYKNDKNQAEEIYCFIKKALKWIDSLGAFKTVGFGRLLDIKTELEEKIPDGSLIIENDIKDKVNKEKNKKIGYILTPLAPFCIAKRRIVQNLYESEVCIPGNIIKGAVASQWAEMLGKNSNAGINKDFDNDKKELCENFEKIRFSFAFPQKKENGDRFKRPVNFPLSIVSTSDKKFYDVADFKEPILINRETPAFSIDWKSSNFEKINKIFGWSFPGKELKIRTAIDREKGSAKESQLFGYEMVIPDGFHWLGYIDFSDVPDNVFEKTIFQLQTLLNMGLNGWGKTKTTSQISLFKPTEPFVKSDCNKNDTYIITLQTPAILCNPEELLSYQKANKINNILEEHYREIWNKLSDCYLRLENFFATQTMAGGFYIHKKFQSDKPYYPFLLTEQGSVFVLKVNGATEEIKNKASEKINEWLQKGLPMPEWAKEKYRRNNQSGDHWSNCPYIRENGYGEIVVNLSFHSENKPKTGEYENV